MVSTLEGRHETERFLLQQVRALTALRLRALARTDWRAARALGIARTACLQQLDAVIPTPGHDLLSAA